MNGKVTKGLGIIPFYVRSLSHWGVQDVSPAFNFTELTILLERPCPGVGVLPSFYRGLSRVTILLIIIIVSIFFFFSFLSPVYDF